MRSIVRDAYDDASQELKKIVPEKMQISFKKNKKKFIYIIVFAVSLELLILSGVYEIIFG